MLIQADARCLPLRDACVDCVVTSPPYWGQRLYPGAGSIGQESSLTEYVRALLEVFSEVWRVLKAQGVCWINIGDCFANDGKWGGETGGKQAYLPNADRRRDGRSKRTSGLKQKDLVGIPWTVAFALRDAGWYLRRDIVWAKGLSFCPTYAGSAMPESVEDRPSTTHEYVFLLTKSAKYFYDADAVKEPASLESHARAARQRSNGHKYDGGIGWNGDRAEVWNERARRVRAAGVNPKAQQGIPGVTRSNESFSAAVVDLVADRNLRSVWAINPQPYAGAHFATFPEALVQPCILAGCPRGGLCLDPFMGSGTVGAVAQRLGRRWVGIDLAYHDLAKERTAQRGLRFTEVTA
jgi:DNA modification methylase